MHSTGCSAVVSAQLRLILANVSSVAFADAKRCFMADLEITGTFGLSFGGSSWIGVSWPFRVLLGGSYLGRGRRG